MATARQLVEDAFESAGIFKPTQTIAAQDAAFGIKVLNRIVRQWQNDQYFPYGQSKHNFVINTTTNVYTIGGAGANWNIGADAVRITAMRYLAYSAWVPVRQVSYEDLHSTTQVVQGSDVPWVFAFNRGMPYGTIEFFAAPPSDYSVEILVDTIVPDYDLDSVVSLPTGYYGLLVAEVGARMGPTYGVDIGHLRAEADAMLNSIKIVNAAPPLMKVPSGEGTYDIYSDTIVQRSF